MNENMLTSEVLNRAADLIEERGWAHGVAAMNASEGAPICLEGAISAVLRLGIVPRYDGLPSFKYPAYECPAYRAVADYLDIDPAWGRAYDWNDEQGRTADEVIEVLRAVALIEAAREAEPITLSPEPIAQVRP